MMRDIGKNIRELRLRAGFSQDELAERLFVTRQTVSNYENGRTRPDVEQILRLAEIFGTDANAVLYGPPVPESRRRAVSRAVVGGGMTAMLDLYLVLCVVWGLVVITGGNLNVLNDTVMHSSLYYKAFNMFNPFL